MSDQDALTPDPIGQLRLALELSRREMVQLRTEMEGLRKELQAYDQIFYGSDGDWRKGILSQFQEMATAVSGMRTEVAAVRTQLGTRAKDDAAIRREDARGRWGLRQVLVTSGMSVITVAGVEFLRWLLGGR
jgi:regulator of replication initiation timing